MDRLSVFLALNGAAVLVVSMLAGITLRNALMQNGRSADWHLIHAGGTSRGVMLLALAATINLAVLSEPQLWASAILIIFFVWTSVLAMLIRAISGDPGFDYSGNTANKAIFLLYASGTVTVFIGFGWFMIGLGLAFFAT